MFKKIIMMFLLLLAVSSCFYGCSVYNNPAAIETSALHESIIETTIDESTVKPTIQEGIGGDLTKFYFSSKYKSDFCGINGNFTEIVGDDEFYNWGNEFYNGEREIDEFTIQSFINDFNISKEDFIKINDTRVMGYGKFTSEQIDILYSGNQVAIDKEFVSEYAIFANNNIYTLEWLVNHSTDDYKANSITPEQIKSLIENMKGVYQDYNVTNDQVELLSQYS